MVCGLIQGCFALLHTPVCLRHLTGRHSTLLESELILLRRLSVQRNVRLVV